MTAFKRPIVRQTDMRRMMRAAHAEGLTPRAIRVATTGDVTIDVGDAIEQIASPLDEWRGRHGSLAQRH
jgi:hypothetical protein